MIEKLSILLVEDDDVAAEAVQRSLRKAGLHIPVVVAENGEVGLSILRGESAQPVISPPYVVLLDLNMPVMSGFEFLEAVRADANLSNTVIFVLTTSNADSDRSRAYHKNIAGYMVKSEVGPQFSKVVNLLDSYRQAVEPVG